jgi:hypothetical protein
MSYVMPLCEGAIRWRLTLLELVESDAGFEECGEVCSLCAATFAL